MLAALYVMAGIVAAIIAIVIVAAIQIQGAPPLSGLGASGYGLAFLVGIIASLAFGIAAVMYYQGGWEHKHVYLLCLAIIVFEIIVIAILFYLWIGIIRAVA